VSKISFHPGLKKLAMDKTSPFYLARRGGFMKHAGRVFVLSYLVILNTAGGASGQASTNQERSSPIALRDRVAADASVKLGAGNQPVYLDLYEGLKMSLRVWDLPLLTAGSWLERNKPGQSVTLPPFELDHEISEMVARTDGKKSLGALKPAYYPGLAATSRLAGMIALDVAGLHDYSATSYAKMFRFHQALYYTKVVTRLAKHNIQRYRPDHSDTQSFFSGHTSTAFATSTFLYLEARDFIDGHDQSLPVLSPRGWKIFSFGMLYGWAGYVGYSRIHDKKHYLSDVLLGAASGTLISYLLYPHPAKPGKIRMDIQPLPGGLGLGIQL
jgi:membrane-associated phospholipid phosphatase